MGIYEAIEHLKEKIECMPKCQCRKEHEQLLSWLEELKRIKRSNKKL